MDLEALYTLGNTSFYNIRNRNELRVILIFYFQLQHNSTKAIGYPISPNIDPRLTLDVLRLAVNNRNPKY
jgi:hypothetical protein